MDTNTYSSDSQKGVSDKKLYKVTKWDKYPFLSYLSFLLLIVDPHNLIFTGFIATIICLAVTYYCKLKENKEQKKKKEEQKNEDKKNEKTKDRPSRNSQFRIFAAVFGFIAALSMTNTLETFDSENYTCIGIDNTEFSCLDYPSNFEELPEFFISPQIMLVASFFSIGILMYHCGIMFLSTHAAYQIAKGHPIVTFFSSLLIFLEGIVLFVAASAVTNISQYALWMFFLIALDIGWVLLNLFKRLEQLFQWLHLDLAMMIFLLILVMSMPKTTDIEFAGVAFEYWALLVVFVFRTVTDYHMGWKYWSIFIPTE
ncbi:MAG: hypothetical protein ACREAE_10145 [Nitrosopumilaceae archaeon]